MNTCRKLKLRKWSCLFQIAEAVFLPKFVISTFESSVFFIFVLFKPHKKKEVKSGYESQGYESQGYESQTQVIHALNISLYTFKDSTFFGAQL